MSGGFEGQKLHKLLNESGLSKSQRAGMTHLLSSFSEVGGSEMTVGDIRALTKEELIRLLPEMNWGPPTLQSTLKVKKLLG